MEQIETRNELLRLLPKNMIIAELGVFTGRFSDTILSICEPKELHLVDTWEGEISCTDENDETVVIPDMSVAYNGVRQKYSNNSLVTLHRMTSQKMLESFDNNYFDFIYIDADHSYNATLRELTDWYPKIKNGGWVCGHDYFQSTDYPWVQCKRAIDEFATEYDGELIVTTTDTYPNWAFKKEISYGE